MKSTRYSIHFSFCKPRWGLHQTLLYTRLTYTAYTHNEFSKKYLYDFISKVNFCCFVELLFISPDVNNMNISFQASALIIMLEDLNQFSFVRSFEWGQFPNITNMHTTYQPMSYVLFYYMPSFQSDFYFPTCVSTSNIIYFIIMMISNVNNINITKQYSSTYYCFVNEKWSLLGRWNKKSHTYHVSPSYTRRIINNSCELFDELYYTIYKYVYSYNGYVRNGALDRGKIS